MKQEEKTERTREKILRAAMEEFGAHGYAGASLNSICGTGISKGLLYHNFAGKDALFLACVEQCFAQLTEFLRQRDPQGDPERYLEARLCFFREHPQEARLFFEAMLQPPEPLWEQIRRLRKDFDAFNRTLYGQMLDRVVLRPGVDREEALGYFSLFQEMFNGYFSSPACRGLSFDDRMAAHEANLPRMFDFLLYGIAEGRREP